MQKEPKLCSYYSAILQKNGNGKILSDHFGHVQGQLVVSVQLCCDATPRFIVCFDPDLPDSGSTALHCTVGSRQTSGGSF